MKDNEFETKEIKIFTKFFKDIIEPQHLYCTILRQ